MISIASSIRFRKSDGLLPSFDNTLFEDESHFRIAKHPYYHKLFSTDTVTIQAEVDTGQLMEMQYATGTRKMGCVIWSDYGSMSGETKVHSATSYDYWEVDIAMTSYTLVRFRAVILESEAVVEMWYSEPVEIVTDDGSYFQD